MKRQEGYTLVELIVVVVLVAIVASSAGLLLKYGFESYRAAKPIISVAGKANAAMDNLMRELEGARSFTTGSTTSITFINQSGNTIQISLSGTNIIRTENGGTARNLCTDLLPNIGPSTPFSFAFFGSAFATVSPSTFPNNVRFISLNFTVSDGTNAYPLIGGTVLRKLLP